MADGKFLFASQKDKFTTLITLIRTKDPAMYDQNFRQIAEQDFQNVVNKEEEFQTQFANQPCNVITDDDLAIVSEPMLKLIEDLEAYHNTYQQNSQVKDPDISSTVPIPEVDITNVFQIIFLQYFRDVLQNY